MVNETEIRSLIEDLGTVPYEMREPIEQKILEMGAPVVSLLLDYIKRNYAHPEKSSASHAKILGEFRKKGIVQATSALLELLDILPFEKSVHVRHVLDYLETWAMRCEELTQEKLLPILKRASDRLHKDVDPIMYAHDDAGKTIFHITFSLGLRGNIDVLPIYMEAWGQHLFASCNSSLQERCVNVLGSIIKRSSPEEVMKYKDQIEKFIQRLEILVLEDSVLPSDTIFLSEFERTKQVVKEKFQSSSVNPLAKDGETLDAKHLTARPVAGGGQAPHVARRMFR
ncbi:MAG: hypothetical protein AABX38_06045 [Candidatus Micrarchaeota archaeon]